jgi:CRISPR system Cascade subunit CasC
VDRLAESSGDLEGSIEAAVAFVNAAIAATPSGKSNGMASYEVPALVVVEVRPERRPLSYLGAFEAPVRPRGDESMTSMAVDRLLEHIAKCDAFQGQSSLHRFYLSLDPHPKLPPVKNAEEQEQKKVEEQKAQAAKREEKAEEHKESQAANIEELLANVRAALSALVASHVDTPVET